MIPLGLGGAYLLTAWWCFLALLCDRNRPDLVVDWEAGKGRWNQRPGEVIYRDQHWREHVVFGQCADDELEVVGAPPPERSEPLDNDGPCQWDELEVLR